MTEHTIPRCRPHAVKIQHEDFKTCGAFSYLSESAVTGWQGWASPLASDPRFDRREYGRLSFC